MKKAVWIILIALVVVGCKKTGPDLRIADRSAEVPSPPAIHSPAQGAVIVTGEPATKDDEEGVSAPTAEDKTGAVAVKVPY